MKLVIFDLDGTLTPQRPSSSAPFQRMFLEGMADACARLRARGVTLAVATNQGGIRKGLSAQVVEEHLAWVCETLQIAGYRYPVEPARKKPNAAMLHELMAQFGAEPSETCFVGDDDNDRLAAERAGIRFVESGAFTGNF
jgi:HAD superfamily hydrolase (TIGR01662 family)